MNFEFVDSLELNIETDLVVLERDSQRYTTMFLQHEGILEANENRIGNREDTTEIFKQFLLKAKETRADLVATPEYSCPWSVLVEILNDEAKWPDKRKLWVIGAESIKLSELETIKENCPDNVLIHFESDYQRENLSYIDPVVYVYRNNSNETSSLVFLVQFKTSHMGVWSNDTERNYLIEGKTIYILRNQNNSINFLTLICSEAMNFSSFCISQVAVDIEWVDKPYLIFNPQLNPKPTASSFIDFRKFVMLQNDKEILSLNWNINSDILGTRIENDSARTAIYLKSSEVELNRKERIIHNHKKGLYYFHNKNGQHTYLFTSTIHVLIFENLPVKITGHIQSQIKRDGPEMKNVFIWEEDQNHFSEVLSVDDHHIQYLKDYGVLNHFILDDTNCVLDKEKLCCLLTANVNSRKSKWFEIKFLASLFMDPSSEINNRITVARNYSSESKTTKNNMALSIIEMETILADKSNIPSTFPELLDEIAISYYQDSKKDDFRFNIIKQSDKSPILTTVSYIGLNTKSEAEQSFINLRRLFNRHENMHASKVLVYYKNGNIIEKRFDKIGTSITNTNEYGDISILKDDNNE